MPPRASIDRRLFAAVNALPHPAYLDEQLSLLSDLGKGAGWVGGACWLAFRDGRRGRRSAAAAVGAMLAAIAVVQGPAKRAIRRRRPFVERHLLHRLVLTRRRPVRRAVNLVGNLPVDPSFPSGHTAGSFAAATALTCFYPDDGPLLLGTASAVGASRVYLGHHFPSDVVVGALMGAAAGLLAYRVLRLPR